MTQLRSFRRRAALAGGLLACSFAGACNGSDDSNPTPVLLAPSTGTVWGGMRSIRWVPAELAAATVRIQLSADAGATFPTDLALSTADDGEFTFDTTGFADGVQYRVRVLITDGPVLASPDFAIDNTAPQTVLTSPVGSEIWGGVNTITWTTTDVHPGSVALRLSSDSGANFDVVITASTPDDGSFDWDASGLPDGMQYRVEVTPTDLADNEGAADSSGADFQIDNTLPDIVLTSPVGGESWSGLQMITWTTTESNPGTVALSLSLDSGATYPVTIEAAAPDTGSFAWQTGLAPDGAAFRVRAVATDAAGNDSPPSSSGADFGMTNMRMTSPAHYLDANGNAMIDAGDQLYLKFDKNVAINGAAASDFMLGVAGDGFGAGAALALGPELDSLLLTLGANPTLRTRGMFAEDSVAAGRPSGMDVSAMLGANVIEEAGTGLDASPSGIKDVRPDLARVDVGFGSGAASSCVAAGDFDRDGDVDFLVGDAGGSSTQVLVNNGSGGFVIGATVAAAAVHAIAAGDVDGDGDLDHVVANGAGANVSLGDGAGAFAAYGASFGAGTSRAVVLADFDCDGDLDLFLGNTGGEADRVFSNDGTGAFTDTGQALGNGNTESAAAGDLDGDGDVDLVAVSNDGGVPVRVWINDGTGAFTAGDAVTLTAAQSIALGDMDGDGDLDVVLGVLGQNETILNAGDGTFGATFQFFGNNDNRGVALLDLDGDGDLDVATVKFLDGERWWFNDGTGRVTESTVRGAPDDAVGVVAARIDGDSDVDLFVAVQGANHRWYRASVSGGQPAAVLADAMASIPLLDSISGLAGDFDRDGEADVAATVVGGGARILFGDGAGTFTAGTPFGANGLELFGAGDVDCDGDLDLVARDPATPAVFELWLNAGDGTFTAGLSGLAEPISAFTDADGNGTVDFVGLDGTGVAELWLGNGAGTFDPSGITFGTSMASEATLADLDGDGDVDVTLAVAGGLEMWENNGGGAYVMSAQLNSAAVDAHVALDFDADGDLDFVAYASSSTGATMLEPVRNDGAFAFTPLAATGALVEHDVVQVLDYDEDGDLDLLSSSFVNAQQLVVHLGDGAGGFTALPAEGVVDLTLPVPGDFDSDGDTDLYLFRYDLTAGAGVQHLLYVRD